MTCSLACPIYFYFVRDVFVVWTFKNLFLGSLSLSLAIAGVIFSPFLSAQPRHTSPACSAACPTTPPFRSGDLNFLTEVTFAGKQSADVVDVVVVTDAAVAATTSHE